MRRFTTNEIAALILATMLILGGASLVLWPQRGYVPHEARSSDLSNADASDVMDAPKSRTVGVVSIACGVVLAAFTLYRGKP